MSSNSEKNEKSLAEFIMIVVLVGILMSVIINYYIKQEAQLSDVGFKTLAQKFTAKISTTHVQWLMDKQPNIVAVALLNSSTKQHITVNKQGWIDVKRTPLACERIWRLVMESPLNFMQQSIAALELRTTSMNQAQQANMVCRYILPSGAYFDYNPFNGNVSAIGYSESL